MTGRQRAARLFVGLSGYAYPEWRGAFYPESLPRARWLEYASRIVPSIELNATFYGLQTPAAYRRWAAAVPGSGFVFAIKGSRFITHNLRLSRPMPALANFFASGVLELGRTTGPFLWQLPPALGFDAERVEQFLCLLPRTTARAESLARHHDRRLERGRIRLRARARLRLRHAVEPRHPSFFCDAFYDLLRRHGCALVAADTAGRYPMALEATADFAYVRLHGATALYAGSYGDPALRAWARRVRAWRREHRDVYVYFDNDVGAAAPRDALRLMRLLRIGAGASAQLRGQRAPG